MKAGRFWITAAGSSPQEEKSEPQGSAGLSFEARLPDVHPDQLDMQVKMGADGSCIELRDQDKQLLFRLLGKQMDEYSRSGALDFTSPATLKDGVVKLWKNVRRPVEAPAKFVLDLSGVKTVDQLVGRLKLLLDWAAARQDMDVGMDRLSPPVLEPESPAEPVGDSSPGESSPDESTDEDPDVSDPTEVSEPEVSEPVSSPDSDEEEAEEDNDNGDEDTDDEPETP